MASVLVGLSPSVLVGLSPSGCDGPLLSCEACEVCSGKSEESQAF